MDKFLGKIIKKNDSIDSELSPEDEIDSVIAKSSVQEIKKQKQKKLFVRLGVLCGVLFVGYVTYMAFQPRYGDASYGRCKLFMQLHVQYPHTISLHSTRRIANQYNTQNLIRIWYSFIDSYGQHHMQSIECFIKPDKKYGEIFDEIDIDRVPVPQEEVDRFNQSLEVLKYFPPDRAMPEKQADKLQNIKPPRFMLNIRKSYGI